MPRSLQLNEARWQAILDTARDAIITIDAEGRICVFNRSAEQIFGYAASEAIGQDVGLLMPEPYRSEHGQYLRRYAATGVAKAIGRVRAVEGRRKNGEIFPLELSVSEARAGSEVIYTAIIRDVTERRRREAKLRELQHLAQQRERLADMGAITAQIAHDLGNPLAALSLQAQLILRRARRDGNQPLSTIMKPAEQILFEVRRLESLVREFMTFAGEQRLEPRKIDVPMFLQQVVDLWRPVAAAQGTRIAVNIPRNLPPLYADEEKLRRVLDNLVKNAVEAIGERSGEIFIRAEIPTPEKLRLLVEDTGPGIADGVQPFRLFETTKSDGTGLGLPVAKQVIVAHGGRIDWIAREPHGTVFRIELPLRGPAVSGTEDSPHR